MRKAISAEFGMVVIGIILAVFLIMVVLYGIDWILNLGR